MENYDNLIYKELGVSTPKDAYEMVLKLKNVYKEYNRLEMQIAEHYDEHSDSDLIAIGELTASHFGYL